jgi:hypothetical protein
VAGRAVFKWRSVMLEGAASIHPRKTELAPEHGGSISTR